jgi:hypothetical protein
MFLKGKNFTSVENQFEVGRFFEVLVCFTVLPIPATEE